MDVLLQSWFDELTGPLLQMAAANALPRAAMTLLVAARLVGFFCIGPLVSRAMLPWRVRLGLIASLTLIVAPGLPLPVTTNPAEMMLVSHQGPSRAGGWRGDNTLSGLPDRALDGEISSSTLNSIPQVPPWESAGTLIFAAACDAGVGAVLGLCVVIFLSGLKLGGEWLDRHSGLGLGSVLNPEYSAEGSVPGQLVSLFCVAVILVMPPMNGHLQLIRYVLETFHAIPVGSSQVPSSVTELVGQIVQQSLVLGLRIAMPLVVAMSLVDMTLGWIRRTSRWDLAPTAFAIRAATALLILAATFPGIQEAVTSSMQELVGSG